MHKYAFRAAAACAILIVVGARHSSGGIWDRWKDDDEEYNMGISGDSESNASARRISRPDDETLNVDRPARQLYSARPREKQTIEYSPAKGPRGQGADDDGYKDAEFFDISIANNSKPLILCRQKGCTEINDRMTQSYIFNSIASLLYANDKTKVYLCEADTYTRACRSNGLKYAVNIGGTAGVIYIPSLTITDVSFSQNLKRINFMFSYDIYANGLKSFCTSAHNTIDVNTNKQVLIRDNNYKCQLTSDVPSTSYNIYSVDYLDLDYGIIGAYYSTGMTGASSGGSNGYALMKFQYTDQDAVPSKGSCDDESACEIERHRIAPGQYEIMPYDK